MKIEFCIRDREQYETAKNIFNDCQYITVNHKSITDASYNTIVSAGNSFAEMNGGVDGMINSHLSSYTPTKYIQDDVKKFINEKFAGELPVGQSIIIPTQHPTHKYLIYTPTMRVAEDISKTLNAYLAFRSVLLIMKRNNIDSASTPLFCTGAGCMDVAKACKQMKEAYLSVTTGNLIGGNWQIYHNHHRYLNNL